MPIVAKSRGARQITGLRHSAGTSVIQVYRNRTGPDSFLPAPRLKVRNHFRVLVSCFGQAGLVGAGAWRHHGDGYHHHRSVIELHVLLGA